MTEEWNDGRMGKNIGLSDVTQYSNIPIFQYSMIPILVDYEESDAKTND
jgi:hypothetical protein